MHAGNAAHDGYSVSPGHDANAGHDGNDGKLSHPDVAVALNRVEALSLLGSSVGSVAAGLKFGAVASVVSSVLLLFYFYY